MEDEGGRVSKNWLGGLLVGSGVGRDRGVWWRCTKSIGVCLGLIFIWDLRFNFNVDTKLHFCYIKQTANTSNWKPSVSVRSPLSVCLSRCRWISYTCVPFLFSTYFSPLPPHNPCLLWGRFFLLGPAKYWVKKIVQSTEVSESNINLILNDQNLMELNSCILFFKKQQEIHSHSFILCKKRNKRRI